jgi:hypothetical protein
MGRGRPAGSKDDPTKPRKNAAAKTMDANEFMPTGNETERGQTKPETGDEFMPSSNNKEGTQTLQAFAASILGDATYRDSLKKRATAGKLTPAEARLLVELGTREAGITKSAPKEGLELWLTFASTTEKRMIARVAARALGRPYPEDPVRRSVFVNPAGVEIVSWQ